MAAVSGIDMINTEAMWQRPSRGDSLGKIMDWEKRRIWLLSAGVWHAGEGNLGPWRHSCSVLRNAEMCVREVFPCSRANEPFRSSICVRHGLRSKE